MFSFSRKPFDFEATMASIEAQERRKYDYSALAKQFVDKCPADYPWMKKSECEVLGFLWAQQAGAMTEGPEIAFDEELFATRNRAREDGRLAKDKTGFETYYKNHPVPKMPQ